MTPRVGLLLFGSERDKSQEGTRHSLDLSAEFADGLKLRASMSKKHKETVQKQFTKTADAFAKFAVRDSVEVLAEKVEFVKAQAQELVLDVACGPGAFVLAVAPRVRFALGIDLTPEMLRQARQFQAEKQIANVAFARGEIGRASCRERVCLGV